MRQSTIRPSARTRLLRAASIALVGGVLIVLVLLTSIVWTIANRPVRTTSELVAEAQLLVAGTGILISAVLASTTIYYARQARELVVETRAARIDERLHRDAIAHREAHRQLRAATSALVGSVSDVIALGSVMATALRHRRVWGTKRVESAMEPVVAASKALNRMRYVAPDEILEVAQQLFAQIVEYFRAASSGRGERQLVTLAERMNASKSRLNELVINANG